MCSWQDGHTVTIRLKIGQMSCLEYAAMMGYTEMLEELISASVCSQILRQYFALDGNKLRLRHMNVTPHLFC